MQEEVLERASSDRKAAGEQQENQGVERERLQKLARPQRFKPPEWLPVPRDFCRFPPIRGYGGRAHDRLTPREALLFLGLRYAAYQTVTKLRHEAGMAGGKAAGDAEREHGKMLTAWFKTGKPQPPKGVKWPKKETLREEMTRELTGQKRENWRETAINWAYKFGYKKAAKAYEPPPFLKIHISPFNLLEISGLDAHGLDRKHLAAALERLKRCQIGQWEMFGIVGYQRVGRTLLIELTARWPNGSAVRFEKLPAPLPLASPSALALVLFALPFGKPGGWSRVDHAGLCKLLCIDPRLKRQRRLAMIEKAFAHANQWLASFDRYDRARLKLKPDNLDMPKELALRTCPDGRLRIEWSGATTDNEREPRERPEPEYDINNPPVRDLDDDDYIAEWNRRFGAEPEPEPDMEETTEPQPEQPQAELQPEPEGEDFGYKEDEDFGLRGVMMTGGWGVGNNPPHPPHEGRDWRRIDGKWREGRWKGYGPRVDFKERWTGLNVV